MKLSELIVEDFKVREPAISIYDDDFITDVVYGDIKDDHRNNEWCIVFGNSNQINERANTIIEKYKEKRFKKIVLCGGSKGISNLSNNILSEASRIKKILLESGIPESSIYMDEDSQNTFENIDNAMNIILSNDKDVKSISIITGEYHLRRCILAFKNKYPNIYITPIPSYDGYADKNNWFNGKNDWNTGRCMVIWERNLLTKYAKEGKIYDLEISLGENKNAKKL